MAQQPLFPDPKHEDMNPLPGWTRINFETMETEVYLGEGKWVNLQDYQKDSTKD